MRRSLIACAAGLALVGSAPAYAQRAKDEGVVVRPPSMVRHVVSAAKIEAAATKQYGQLREQATRSNALLPEDNPQVQRVRRITDALKPNAAKWNKRANNWQWEVMVIQAPTTINALCMPGGKMVVFTGLLDRLQLTDDEIAMVMGHEMTHALREHARSRAAKTTLTNVGAGAVAILIGGDVGQIAKVSGGLLTLKFNRDDEREADLIGMELAARAGYNPEAGISLWEKMNQTAKNTQPVLLSTHPGGEERMRRIKASLKRVQPLYEKAKAKRAAEANK
jgi:predicted Zn-dependent protease